MSKKLIIVESPGKVKTIKKILGSEYDVKASVGHVIDLPKKGLGVDVAAGFQPAYEVIPDKQPVIDDLKKSAKKASRVYLAPDPDREGEAISWHLATELGIPLDSQCRITFNAITQRNIEKALEEPRLIDIDKVNAQQSRRILDRLVGYNLSPYLWRRVSKGLSAGRVQSVALRLICEREEEITRFVPQEYYTIDAFYPDPKGAPEPPDGADIAEAPGFFKARLDKIDGKPAKIENGEAARRVVEELNRDPHAVAKVARREKKKSPLPPFITSTLQQEAARRFGFTPTRTMQVAQKLYEGIELDKRGPVGLITYMRTDSLRVEDEAIEAARATIGAKYGAKYLPEGKRVYKAKKGAQDAHEAIRPVDAALLPEEVKGALSAYEWKLYDLIWKRFIASQMEDAIFDVLTIEIAAGDKSLKLTGEKQRFAGFAKVWRTDEREKENGGGEDEESFRSETMPDVAEGTALAVREVRSEQKFTQPKPRYTQASLIKVLEEDGVGRPSTYATIVKTIQDRGYVDLVEKKFRATDLGIITNTVLGRSFDDIVNVEFTAKMEEELDKIEAGEKDWVKVLREFYDPFAAKLKEVAKAVSKMQTKTDVVCTECGSPMLVTFSSTGKFLTCAKYPECKATQNIPPDYLVFPGYYEEDMTLKIDATLAEHRKTRADARAEAKVIGTCEKCGKPMVEKMGRFGLFAACSGYPECKNTKAIPKTIGVPCPNEGCTGDVVVRKSRTGKIFYSCTRYSKDGTGCEFVSWDRPIPEKCPECGSFLVTKKSKKGEESVCSKKECKFRRAVAPAPAEAGAAFSDSAEEGGE